MRWTSLPSVFTEVRRYRRFIADPSPVWAPSAIGPSRISGTPRVGRVLRCTAPATSETPLRVGVVWRLQGRSATIVGRRRSYRVRRTDRGRRLACFAEVSNDGGVLGAPVGPRSLVRIARG